MTKKKLYYRREFRDNEALLLAYVRYIDKSKFAEDMLFCKSLETTITATNIYNKLKHYLHINNIPKKNITSCAADGAPVKMARKMAA